MKNYNMEIFSQKSLADIDIDKINKFKKAYRYMTENRILIDYKITDDDLCICDKIRDTVRLEEDYIITVYHINDNTTYNLLCKITGIGYTRDKIRLSLNIIHNESVENNVINILSIRKR